MNASRNTNDDDKVCSFLEAVRRRCPDNVPVLESLGDLYTKLGRLEDGLAIDRILTSHDSRNDTYWYNLACSLALLEREREAIDALSRAVDLGYDDADWMLRDKDLASLRKNPAFARLLAQVKARSEGDTIS